MMAPAAGLGWRPGIGTATLLLVAALFAGWLFTPTWSGERGIDAKDLYAAASLQSHAAIPTIRTNRARSRTAFSTFPLT
jgi:hypothetical protein